MYANKIQRRLRETGRLFDTETGGFYRGQGVFSYAFMGYDDKNPTSRYLKNPDQTNWSQFSKNLYATTKIDPSQTYAPSEFKGHMVTDILQHLEQGGTLVGHNIGFDITAVGQELGYDSPLGKRLYDALKLDTTKQLKSAVTPEKVSNLMSAGKYVDAFRAYGESVESGQIKLVDTMDLTRMMLGMAEERGVAKFGGDLFLGNKLEVLSYALGGKEQIHDAGEDIKLMGERVNNFLFSTLNHLEHGSSLPEDNKRVLKYISDLRGTKEKPGLIGYHLRKTLAESALEYHRTGKFLYGTNPWDPEGEFQDSLINLYEQPRELRGDPAYVESWDNFIKENKSFDITGNFQKNYGYTADDFKTIFDEFHGKYAEKSYEEAYKAFAEEFNPDSFKRVLAGVDGFQPVSREFRAGESLGRALTSKKTLMWAGIGLGAVALATGYAKLNSGYSAPPPQRISGKDDDYNTIEGLHPGGGVNKEMIQSMTDFGSGYKGLAFGVGTAAGFIKARYIDKKKRDSKGQALVGFAASFADDAAVLGINALIKRSSHPSLEKIKGVIESNFVQIPLMAMGGYALGEFAAQVIPGFDDAYNTIEGLHVGAGPKSVGRSKTQSMTDFGSGYKGPNPQLNPEYNEAEDIERYKLVRASKIGLSEDELYKWMTQPDKDSSEYVMASASAGTALHQYMQAQEAAKGNLIGQEELVVNRSHGITGHIDVIKKGLGPGDIKTVNNGIFNVIAREGKPKPMHRDQLMFYLGQTGYDQGFIQYVNRDNLRQQKTYTVNFNPYEYEALLSKVERARARVENDIARGIISKSSLPKTASIETLEEYQEDEHESLEQAALGLDEKRRMFYEEMAYLRTLKRGMPTMGPGAQRVRDRHREKRESAMVSTQGIGLQQWNNHNKHHYM